MAQIRQEINIIDGIITAAGDNHGIVQLDTTQYNGTVTYYFEVVAKVASGTLTVALERVGTTTQDATVSITETSFTLKRSTAFTPPAGQTVYNINLANGTTPQVKSARIIVIQNVTTLTNTETQIEIGNKNTSRTAETATILTNPKYWKYDALKWDGTKTFYAEAVYATALSNMDTMDVYLYEATDITAPSWSAKATIFSGTPGVTTPLRSRVAFTPVDGRWYTIFSLNGSMDNHDIYRAGVVVDQIGSSSGGVFVANALRGGTNGSGETLQARAQAFQSSSADTISGVKLILQKNSSPADNLTVDLVDSLTGSALASGTIAGSALSTKSGSYTATFGTPYAITANTTYYIRLTRSVDTFDSSNYYEIYLDSVGTYANGAVWTRSNNSWNENTSVDMSFELIGSSERYTVDVTLLESQYLLANTLFAAGTALQTFLTDWDSTEWDDGAGSIAYTFQAEAANGSTSDVTLQEADGGGLVTGSTLTNIDNAQISAAMTMPTDQNLDVIANANAGDVAAARILVAYVFSAAEGEPATTERTPTRRRGGPTLSAPGIYGWVLLILSFFR